MRPDPRKGPEIVNEDQVGKLERSRREQARTVMEICSSKRREEKARAKDQDPLFLSAQQRVRLWVVGVVCGMVWCGVV